MERGTWTTLHEIEETKGKSKHPGEDTVDDLGPFHLLPRRLQVDGANDRVDCEGDASIQSEFCSQLG